MSDKAIHSPPMPDSDAPLSTCSENDVYDNLLETTLHNEIGAVGKPGMGSADIHVLTDLKRISCFLAGEIEVPDGVPGWKILCCPPPTVSSESLKPGQKRARLKETDRIATKRKKSREMGHLDIRIPSGWEACLLVLWEHAIQHSFLTQSVCRDAFVERIRRIGAIASRSLQQHGFFTIKHLLGLTRATRLCQWARDCWCYQRHLFRAGKLSSDDRNADFVPTEPIRTDLVAWFYPDDTNSLGKTASSFPEVRLLLLYLDAVVRSMGCTLTNRNACQAHVDSRSWSALSVYQKQANGVGYVSHYDNPSNLADGRILTALYYLNPTWQRNWGGQLIIWPRRNNGENSEQSPADPDNTASADSSPLAILPTLDRLVLFYADERTPHRVQPVFPTAEVDERFAISTWYFDSEERMRFLTKFNSNTDVGDWDRLARGRIT
ncbi:hypothetical protein CRM22_004498 [Opisthorchis felineus]|uniref:hypoxia-inducible factor-proline dioxygenase n=1 Tax=Opisthorchis felineus TaxID=147828 RepID=A0A4S2M271_OPIFE|nr:hypothetical protein CRM22_004498 [Opisthorchis felineus]